MVIFSKVTEKEIGDTPHSTAKISLILCDHLETVRVAMHVSIIYHSLCTFKDSAVLLWDTYRQVTEG